MALIEPAAWTPERVDSTIDQGRTQPLVVECSSASGERGLFVAKPMGFPEVTAKTALREVFGSLLARELGVDVPTPAFIDIDAAFVDATRRLPVLSGREMKPGRCFGSAFLGRGLASPTLDTRFDSDALKDSAARLYGFDLTFQNSDRLPKNPNCVLYRDRVVAFDFERAFEFLWRPAPPGNAVTACRPDQLWIARRHLLYGPVSRHRDRLLPFLDDLAKLPGPLVESALDWMPAQWHHDGKKIAAHLKAIHADFDAFRNNLLGAATP
jgi:hypothetical protein